MDNDNKLKSTSERTASTIKRTLPDKDKTDCASKNLNMFRAAVLIDELCPEAVVGNLSIEQMLGVLYAEGHFSKGPPPKRREPVAILLPRPDSGKKPIVINGSVSFGRGPSCDIVLTEYGTCANISDHQATIIYDRSTGIFELLNYGRTFTMVDDYGYSNGLKLPDPMPGCPIKALIANRKKVNAGNEETIDESNVNDACQVKEGKVVNPCEQMRYMKYCSPGPAVVKHGSTLRFGCIEFIFCSLNQN